MQLDIVLGVKEFAASLIELDIEVGPALGGDGEERVSGVQRRAAQHIDEFFPGLRRFRVQAQFVEDVVTVIKQHGIDFVADAVNAAAHRPGLGGGGDGQVVQPVAEQVIERGIGLAAGIADELPHRRDFNIDHVGDAGARHEGGLQLGPEIRIRRQRQVDADIGVHIRPDFVDQVLHPLVAVVGEAPQRNADLIVLGADHADGQGCEAAGRQRCRCRFEKVAAA